MLARAPLSRATCCDLVEKKNMKIWIAAFALAAAPAMAHPGHEEHDCCARKDEQAPECCAKKEGQGKDADCCAKHKDSGSKSGGAEHHAH
jgi:hypothetical protein